MRTGVNVGVSGVLPDPAGLPVAVARFQAVEPPPFIWVMPQYVKALKEAGKDGLARFNWRSNGIAPWAENVNVELHEFGNEPPLEDWADYRPTLTAAAPILHDARRKVVLAASAGKRTHEWLSTTPDSVFEAVDAVAIHPYELTPRAVLEHALKAREVIPAHLPMIVSEIGISVDARGQRGNFPVIDPTNKTLGQIELAQAHFIRHTFRLLREHAAELKLILTVCFCLDTYPTWVLKRWADCAVKRANGTKRPAWHALAAT